MAWQIRATTWVALGEKARPWWHWAGLAVQRLWPHLWSISAAPKAKALELVTSPVGQVATIQQRSRLRKSPNHRIEAIACAILDHAVTGAATAAVTISAATI